MAVPTSFSDLSTTAASNSPSGSETPAEGDNHFRITYAMLRSILDNSGNGWVSPYWALTATGPSVSATTVTWSGNPTHSGNHTFSGNFTVQGNTTLGNGTSDTTSTTGAVTMNPPASGRTLTIPMGATGLIAAAITAGSGQPAVLQLAGNGTTPGSSSFDVFQGVTSIANLRNRANTDMEFDTNNTKQFVITSDGRIYGTAIHNNAGAVTGTTNQYVASGTYTPTGTATTNIDSVSSLAGMWTRVGNVVSVSITASVDTTAGASTATTLGLSLPIASNFTATSDCVGTCTTGGTGISGAGASVFADTTNDRISVQWLANTTGATTIYLTAQYVVL